MQTRFKQAFLSGDNKKQKGISLLIVIIILAAALLIMSVSALVIGLGERESGTVFEKGNETVSLADGCMNEAYMRIRKDASYGIGQGSLPFTTPNGSCTIQVIDLGSNQRQIDSTAQIDQYTKHVRSTIQIDPSGGVLLTWEERSD